MVILILRSALACACFVALSGCLGAVDEPSAVLGASVNEPSADAEVEVLTLEHQLGYAVGRHVPGQPAAWTGVMDLPPKFRVTEAERARMSVTAHWNASNPTLREMVLTLDWEKDDGGMEVRGASPLTVELGAPLPASEFAVGLWAKDAAVSLEDEVTYVVTLTRDPQGS